MICPKCGFSAEQNEIFCPRCGTQLQNRPPRRSALGAIGRALCYYFLFVVVQSVVTGVYAGMLAASMMYEDMMNAALNGNMLDFLTAFEAVYEVLYEKIHILLILSALITVLIVFLSLRLRRKNPVTEVHLRPIPGKSVLPALLFGAALQVFAVITISLIPIPEDVLNSFSESSALLSSGPFWLELLSVVIVTPILEELIFRGLVFTRLRRGMSAFAAVLLSAIIFGWAHGNEISFVYAAVFGILLALVMRRQNDSILAPILMHAGFNGTSYLLSLLGEEINTFLFLALYLVSIALSVICGYLLLRKPAADEHEIPDTTSQS